LDPVHHGLLDVLRELVEGGLLGLLRFFLTLAATRTPLTVLPSSVTVSIGVGGERVVTVPTLAAGSPSAMEAFAVADLCVVVILTIIAVNTGATTRIMASSVWLVM